MLSVNNIEVNGFEGALRGIRNPMNSWDKADSTFDNGVVKIGTNDLNLCKALIKAGNSDRKFLRMIYVTMDIYAPLYWWKEIDQYKVATVTDSCSTMHKIHSKDLTLRDFSTEHLNDTNLNVLASFINTINTYRQKFVESKDKSDWWQIIQMLPSSFNQLRTWSGNYETLLSMYFQRRNHKLDEWHVLCNAIKHLPYMSEFINAIEEKKKSE